MKKLIPACLASALFSLHAYAQAPFNTIDSVNINNINASVLVHGDMWWNADPMTYKSKCMFPNGSQKTINFAGSIWMSGYDAGNQLHVAAQTYRQDGNDYWPGPLNTVDTLTYATSHDWAKIWKVNRVDILAFQALSIHTLSNTIGPILTWPAKGNTYAQGNAGVALSITTDMAPFVDLNGNGIYEPLLGEYPDIKGDQALWWVFSDNGPTHSQTHGKPLGVEVHAISYAFNRGTLIDDVVYYEYKIVNKSSNNYHNFRIGQWDDGDLGYYLDDYIGFDSTWRMGIYYNGTNDDGGGAGHPINSYGLNPPQMAITMVVLPGDAPPTYVPPGSFTYYNNDFSVIGDPSNDTQCSNYMRGIIRDSVHFSNDFVGPGIQTVGFGHGPWTNYVYPGDPSDNSQWSECACNNGPSDRRFILSSNDFSLNAGSTEKVVFALIVADSAGGCGATSFNKIRIVADTAWRNYHNIPNSVSNIPAKTTMNIYPNPAHNKLFIEHIGTNTSEETITIYNTIGQAVKVPITSTQNKSVADISTLPAGSYFVRYKNGDITGAARFMKD
jgi:Secretion system C-terminal sorting domain